MNANVIILTQNKIQKGQFLLPFFFIWTKNLQWSFQWMFNEQFKTVGVVQILFVIFYFFMKKI